MPSYEKPAIQIAPRLVIATGILCALFGLLAIRLWYLQVVRGDFFRDQSENNRIRQVFIAPPRGLILDRHGEVLAKNRPAFQLDITLEDVPDLRLTVALLAELTKRTEEELIRAIKSPGRRRPFEPRMVLKDIPRELVAEIEANRWRLPGVQVSVVPARYYPFGSLGAHVIGYIGEISQKQLEQPGYSGYRMGDVVGKTGLEARWERYLQGQRGVQEVVVNALGTKIGQASFEPDRAGQNITTTIDKDVQAAGERALGENRGAVVALDVRNGEVLAMVSGPRFDPNMFVGDIPKGLWADVLQGEGRKLNNRAIQGRYPPGSVFKIFMSAAALDSGVMTVKDRVSCPGHMKVGNRKFHCHKRDGHGLVDHFLAMVQSCDIYFYVVGNRLGVDRIHEYATKFGLGETTGIDLDNEAAGLVPSTKWKRERFRTPEQQRWYPGETPSVAIGQGAVTSTPLQLARAVAAVANGGTLYRPRLIKRIASADGSFIDDQFAPEVTRTVDLGPAVLPIVRDDLVGVVNSPLGTARRSQLPKEWGITVAGKTGTSQVVALEHKDKSKDFEHHALFVAYAPAEAPEIVVVAVVEHVGSGGLHAAPVVRQVLEAYFMKTRSLVMPDSPTR